MCLACLRSEFTRRSLLRFSAALGSTAAASQTFAQAGARPAAQTLRRPGGDFVIRNASLVTMDEKLGEIPRGDIHVRDGAIVAVGPDIDAPRAETIEAADMIAMPGLVDTHWHMWGSSARNMAGDDAKTGYFLFARAVGGVFTPEDNARGVRLSLAEAVNSGVTTVHNWSHNLAKPEYADAEIAAHREFGTRALFGYGYAGVAKADSIIDLDDVARVKNQWFAGAHGDLLTLGVCPRGPENNNVDICRKEWGVARDLGLKISVHMGTAAAKAKARQGVKTLGDAGLLGPDLIIVHDTNTSDDDIDLLAKTKTFVSMSPYTEMRTGFGIPPILRMLDRGVNICLSIDTTTLCGNADMFGIMKALQNVADGSKQSEFALPARGVLEMATMGGARALGLSDRIGSLTPGKRADIVLLRADDINMAPVNDPVRAIVQSAQPANVDTVIVDGKVLKRDGKLLDIDTKTIVADSKETMVRVRAEVERMLAAGQVRIER